MKLVTARVMLEKRSTLKMKGRRPLNCVGEPKRLKAGG
jgi:hypothetical protein